MADAADADADGGASPTRNRRGARTRQELIAAAWRIADEMSLVELLAGLTPSVVANEAGVTTGAFRHHFTDTSDLVAAMVDQHLGERETTYVMDPDEVRHHEATFDAESLRTGVLGYWQLRSRPGERRRAHRTRLLASRAWQTTMVDGGQLGDRLVEGMSRVHVDLDAPSLDALIERLDRVWVPPFTTTTVVRIIDAMCTGLLDQLELEPGAIDEQVFADALSAILLTFSRHAPSAVGLVDFGMLSGMAPTDELRRAQEIAVAALDVVDRDPAELTFLQVALETGRQVAELVDLYGTVQRMSATAFVAVYPQVAESANRYLLTDPNRALVDALCDIARMARDHPHVARALIAERHAELVPGTALPLDIRLSVPLGMALVSPLRSMDRVASNELLPMIGRMVDVTLEVASTTPKVAPAEVALAALACLPDDEVSSPG